jgi:hypothetical protein
MIAIAGGSFLALLFGVFLVFRSGGPAKDSTVGQSSRTTAAPSPSRVTITPTPLPLAAEIPASQPGTKTGDAPAKTKRTKPTADPAANPLGPFEDTKVSPKPRAHPKAQRRIITDI